DDNIMQLQIEKTSGGPIDLTVVEIRASEKISAHPFLYYGLSFSTRPLFCTKMQQSPEGALDHAEYVIASAHQRPPKRRYSSNGEKSLYEKLYDIYVEECEKEPGVMEELRSNVNLLEKLLRRESLPCLVVNLYPGKEGCSLMLKGEHGSSAETIRLPCEEGELLKYLDAEELPPVLVDLLEKSQVNVFHRGCVIAEIRDYRQSSGREPPHYQSRHILLRPTMHTLACDVEAIASDNQKWTQEDKLLLESQLTLATAEPLCLDPSLSVVCTENRLLYDKQKLNTLPMKRSFKRYSMASLNRQQELSRPPPPELRALTSCKKIRESKTGGNSGLKTFKAGNGVDMWKQRPCDLAIPSQVDVEKYAKGNKSVKYDDSQSTVCPTHEVQDGSVFGCEEGSQSQTTKLTLQSLNDPFISGKRSSHKKVRCERQLSPPQSSTDDHSYSFVPGPKTDVGRVVSQSKELVQKSGQCPVQVSHSSGDSAGLRQPSPGKEPEQPKTGSVQSSVPNKGAKHPPPPITLPLNSGRSSSGDSFTSQQASSSHKSPSPAPAPKPPSPSQKFSAEVNRVSLLPATALSTAGSSQRTQVLARSSGLKSIRMVYSGEGRQASGRGSKPMQDSTTGATAPAKSLLATNQQGSRLASSLQALSHQMCCLLHHRLLLKEVFKLLLKKLPVSGPLLQPPPDSLLLNTQQQAKEQPQQQCFYHLIPQQQLQQPTTSHPQQPVPQAPVRGSSHPGPNLPQQGSQLSSALQLQLQPQPQPIRFKILQRSVAVTTVAAQTAQPPPPSEHTASQSEGKMKRSTPIPPKP
ncbi:hypothetical protein E2I00_015459, partial [Balaenoptera physalus]